MAYLHCLVVVSLTCLVVLGRGDGDIAVAEDMVKMFSCTHLRFHVTFEIDFEKYSFQYISKLSAECSNERSYSVSLAYYAPQKS